MEVQDVIRRTKEVLVTRFDLGVQAGAISDNEPIFEAGLGLDSMAAVELLVGIEEAFGVRIDDHDLTASNFETVRSVAQLVHRKIAGRQ